MTFKAYVLIDGETGKTENIAGILRSQPGVVTVDLLEGPPDICVIFEASERIVLAKNTIHALSMVEDMISGVKVLPSIQGINLPVSKHHKVAEKRSYDFSCAA